MSRFAFPAFPRRVLIAAASLLASNLVLAQPAARPPEADSGMEMKDWYKVELIVFAQTAGNSQDGEIWRADLTLDYPLDWMELLKPAELMDRITQREEAAAAAEMEAAVAGLDAGEEIESLEGQLSAGAEPVQSATATAPEAAATAGAEIEPDSTGTAEANKEIEPVEALTEKTLLLLPTEESSLRNEARRLSRSDQHRVLFHGAWLQPLVEDRKQPSVLINGGERFDEHYELEGSINLYRRTYLHIETDLWLAQFATNFGQERRPWPPLPWPPNRTPEPSFLFRIDDGGTGLWHQFNQEQDDDLTDILAQPYVVENLVLMQQGRRMRSNELHYIDHPRMGLLIKITPYEPSATEGEDSGAP